VLLFIVIAIATSGKAPKQAGDTATVTATHTHTAKPSKTPSARTTKKTEPAKTKPARTQPEMTQPAPQAPAATAPAVAPPTTPTTPSNCTPLTDGGNCYEPGEFCRDDDHGMSGTAGDGEAITCEDNDGWRWEPV
jgi:outer membrane biosynthesis protein TonB